MKTLQKEGETAVRAQAEHCMVCGEPLGYHEQPLTASCQICRAVGSTPILCPGGHFVCDYLPSR